MNKQSMVREFMQAVGQTTPDKIAIPDFGTRLLRIKLIHEELQEFAVASGAIADDDPVDIRGIADALGDLLVVVYGAAVSYGINIDPVFGEIHRSNMTKVVDGYRREDGKWMKGPSYEPPRIEQVLNAQGWTS